VNILRSPDEELRIASQRLVEKCEERTRLFTVARCFQASKA
jgi:hypothetical protein